MMLFLVLWRVVALLEDQKSVVLLVEDLSELTLLLLACLISNETLDERF